AAAGPVAEHLDQVGGAPQPGGGVFEHVEAAHGGGQQLDVRAGGDGDAVLDKAAQQLAPEGRPVGRGQGVAGAADGGAVLVAHVEVVGAQDLVHAAGVGEGAAGGFGDVL